MPSYTTSHVQEFLARWTLNMYVFSIAALTNYQVNFKKKKKVRDCWPIWVKTFCMSLCKVCPIYKYFSSFHCREEWIWATMGRPNIKNKTVDPFKVGEGLISPSGHAQ